VDQGATPGANPGADRGVVCDRSASRLAGGPVRELPYEAHACATLCYVKEITHRQMRNESGDVLRRVAAGETILVTNSGQPAAVIGPPPGDVLSLLSAQGQLREALVPTGALRSIKRKKSKKTTTEIVADVRGRW
jgi:prevent-host-death family protein